MELITISEMSRNFNISMRTLRYYEQIGLLQSGKKEDYAYRVYDEAAVLRLQQIIVLRKLRIPLKQIVAILESESAAEIIETFRHNLSEVDDEITALSTIRTILQTFINRLNENLRLDIRASLFDDVSLLDIADSLTVTKINFKEEKTMEDLNKAGEKLNKLTDRDVRIIYLPPATVAASHYIGDEPEHQAAMAIDKFVVDNNLSNIYPGLRHYGFNNPNPVDETNYHGYEMWVTIPEDMEVPEPLVKKRFEGGLYAAHMIPMGAFEEWEWLFKWTLENEKYEYRGAGDSANMFGCLEENLNYVNNVAKFTDGRYDNVQLDLLMPIKKKA